MSYVATIHRRCLDCSQVRIDTNRPNIRKGRRVCDSGAKRLLGDQCVSYHLSTMLC